MITNWKTLYQSLIESLKIAAWHSDIDLTINFINAEALEKGGKRAQEQLIEAQGIIVPIGWGGRGVEGKIAAITYARENKVPYLGLCYGMQLACVEFARNVAHLEDAHSSGGQSQDNASNHSPDPIWIKNTQKIKGNGLVCA